MKRLDFFSRFDWEAFADGKTFEVTAVTPWVDYNNPENVLGKVVEVVIIEDHTDYPANKDGSTVSNRYEKLRVKAPQTALAVSLGDIVEPVNAVATIYGDYRNQLSVRADDFLVISKA